MLLSKLETKGSSCVSFGIPWARGEYGKDDALRLKDEFETEIPVSSGSRAFWPDGSVKWSFHSAKLPLYSKRFTAEKAARRDCDETLASEDKDSIRIDTGFIKASFAKQGSTLAVIGQITAGAVLVLEERCGNTDTRVEYKGCILEACLEENNGIRAVVKIKGTHKNANRELFPFTLRFYFFKNSGEIKITHTFIYDGDSNKDFIKGLGIRFNVPMSGEVYNRHVKIAGDTGIFHEPLKLLTSWRPRLNESIYKAQFKDEVLCFEDTDENKPVFTAIDDITTWDKYKLIQDSAGHFVIRKCTRGDTCAYIDATHGRRSRGLMSLACETGGLAVAVKDFWQKYPSALSVENAAGDTALLTAWLWPPEAEAADLRHYDTEAHCQAYYEGFDEIKSTPYGIANTNELFVKPFTGLVKNTELEALLDTAENPGILVCEPEYYKSAGAFGVWGLPCKDSEASRRFEEKLDAAIEFYINEVEQRQWYGFFNYGDFMHTYDNQRHVWKYDMGGYAWQNTELVPTLWLWLAFMRSGRADIYKLAEAMTRHTSEVDVYHIGEYKGLGSRHNVIHWGCACKEARIAMAGHHRCYYYLTGDERIGDVFDDVRDADYSILNIDPLRHFYNDGQKTHARTGPDWSSFSSNWMTAWERYEDTAARDKLLKGIECIKKAPFRLLSGSNFGYDPDTGELIYIGENSAGGSHLVICMGAPEVWFELAGMLNDLEWKNMMAEYGRFYILPEAEKAVYKPEITEHRLPVTGWAYPYMAAAMIAYAARHYNDRKLALKVWDILESEMKQFGFELAGIRGGPSAFVHTELKGVSTNFIAQWCLNVIVCLELIGEWL